MTMWLGYQRDPRGTLIPVLFSEKPVPGRWNARDLVGQAVEVPDDIAGLSLSYAVAWANRPAPDVVGFEGE